jgi:hypothetical protein
MTSADDTEPLRSVSDLQQAPGIQATSQMELETVAVIDRHSLEVKLWGEPCNMAASCDGVRQRP